jgi:hypothetical protein
MALCGTTGPDWLPVHCAFHRVALALDADQAGDEGAARLTGALQSLGAKVERWRPSLKDWNALLIGHGVDHLTDELHTAAGIAPVPQPETELQRLYRERDELGRQIDRMHDEVLAARRRGDVRLAQAVDNIMQTVIVDRYGPMGQRIAELQGVQCTRETLSVPAGSDEGCPLATVQTPPERRL